MIKFIIVILWGIFWAFMCGNEMEIKRYDPTAWYILGFIFGFFAYIFTLFFKKKEPEFDEVEIQRMVAADQMRALKSNIAIGRVWVCPRCRRTNDRSVEICACGVRKPVSAPALVQGASARPAVGTWTCRNCGMENSNHIFICNCGMKKSENEQT